MLRLFAATGLLTIVLAGLAIGTDTPLLYLLTVALGTAILSLYAWLRRSLPPRSGAIAIKGLRDLAEVFRDERGIPHIYAKSLQDLYLAQGYVTAQDRLWQMDLNRRVASGTMAEVFGPEFIAMDKHFRTLGLRRVAADSLAAYSPAFRKCLSAYAEGVNARLREGALPPEFGLKGYKPEPWTAVDTLAIGKWLAYELSGNWAGELFRARLVQTTGAERAAELFWLLPDMTLLQNLEGWALPDTSALLDLAAQTLDETVGSNAWVVSGGKTKSGAPLLANDPHVAARSPAVWYQSHLVGGDGLDVSGVTIPGMPGILLGQNRHIAWACTNLNPDIQDVFIERPNPTAPDQYAFGGDWEQAQVIQEEIHVRHQPEPIRLEVHVTRHGPVIARDGEAALSLKWTALTPSTELEAYAQINRSGSWAEFKEALRQYQAPALNFLFAGIDGTIACRGAGSIPLRVGGDGQVPVPGWSGEHEWSGFIPFDQLPETVNPPDGFVASATEHPTPPGYAYRMGTGWAAPYRARRIRDKLAGASGLTVDKFRVLQSDTVNLQARQLVELLLHAVQEGLRQGRHPEALGDREKKAMLMISEWDADETPESAGATLWHQWYLFILEGVFRPQMGLELYDHFVSSGMAVQLMDRLILAVIDGKDSAWLGREGETGLPRIALRAFRRAVALVAAKHGPLPDRWRWQKEHQIQFEHPLTLQHRALRPFLNLGAYFAGGSHATLLYQGYHPLRPFAVSHTAAWRQVVDLANPGDTQDVLAPGQSGHPLSVHYSDQLVAWLKGETLPRLYHHDRIRSLPRFVLYPA